MLALHQREDRLRAADNLVPTREGGMATRPGAVQVLDGYVAHAQGWGTRVVAERNGRIVVWDGAVHDIAQAGLVLQAAGFQALIGDGRREDRCYIADGARPLWYVARRGGEFVRADVVNTVRDPGGQPYPVGVPRAVVNWRNRLWIAGVQPNRVQHCQNDAPDEWDPLWTVELQGPRPAQVNAMHPHGEVLVVGQVGALWGVSGTSQYNWAPAPFTDGPGTCGPDAIDGDGERLYWVSRYAVHQLGAPEPRSDDIRAAFDGGVSQAQVVVDIKRRQVLVLAAGRLFVMHQDRPGLWGEIADLALGLIRTQEWVGWYGPDGVWALDARDQPDQYLDGRARAFMTVYDTWEQYPNHDAGGRALLNRTVLQIKGSARAQIRYEVQAHEAGSPRRQFVQDGIEAVDGDVETWSDVGMAGKSGEPWPSAPVRRELAPRISGTRFRHRLMSVGHLEIDKFDPQYRHGRDQ